MKEKKATNEEHELHAAVLNGDDLALSKLYDLHGKSVIRSLKSWYNKVANKDDALILEAVNEALWGYYRNPGTFNPEVNTLKRFLEMAAERDLQNILDREKKHSKKKDLPEDVELQEKFWNSTLKNKNATDGQIIHDQALEVVDRELANHFYTDLDISLAKLVLLKERKTEVFAEVLGIEELPQEKQKEKVKRNKDRIKKVLERNQVEQKLKQMTQ